MDQAVLKVQEWLNNTYSNVSGYEQAPLDGRSTWATIFSLREALQHELGIENVGEAFGDETKSRLNNVVGELQPGYSGNIVQLIQGAFWCKGISPDAFDDQYTDDTSGAIMQLQSKAGLNPDGVVTSDLLAALFDMSAFDVPVSYKEENAGKIDYDKIREMQQYLNRNYGEYIGIQPCDGIYQRNTNTALIYALQATEGFTVDQASGTYGPATIQNTPTLKIGDSGSLGEFVRILQYGLLVNQFYDGPIDGYFSNEVANSIISFREFMNLPPYNGVADLTVFKGLLTSNGNTDRNSDAVDTAAQLDDYHANLLKQYDFNVVGRYLTGSVGTGSNKQDKNLTPKEINSITNAGLSIFPIYQDGGWDQSYFTTKQGIQDAIRAKKAALLLGFPIGTTIYFAVDLDILDQDIDSTVIPYIKAVSEEINYYNVGIYGTRNVCEHAYEEANIDKSFISDMSSGYSGDLAFRMPDSWAFDQFIGYKIEDLAIDQVATSGKDMGTIEFVDNRNYILSDYAHSIIDNVPGANVFQNIVKSVNVGGDNQFTAHTFNADYILDISDDINVVFNDKGKNILNAQVSDGQITSNVENNITKYANLYKDYNVGDYESAVNKLSTIINNGNIQLSIIFSNGDFGIQFKSTGSYQLNDGTTDTLTFSLKVFIRPDGYGFTTSKYKNAYSNVEQKTSDLGAENLLDRVLGDTSNAIGEIGHPTNDSQLAIQSSIGIIIGGVVTIFSDVFSVVPYFVAA